MISGSTFDARPIGGRVLIMDDEACIRELVRLVLGACNTTVDGAVDGEEAESLYRQGLATGARYDLVIMDLHLPRGASTIETLRRIRRLDPDAQAVLCTGHHYITTAVKYREYGFQGLLLKPFECGQLVELVARPPVAVAVTPAIRRHGATRQRRGAAYAAHPTAYPFFRRLGWQTARKGMNSVLGGDQGRAGHTPWSGEICPPSNPDHRLWVRCRYPTPIRR